MTVPGVDPEKIEVSVEGNMLRISGSREEKKETKEKNYLSREITRGSFERLVHLPTDVDSSNTHADYKDGVLKITMPKKKETLVDKIKINVKK